MLGLGNGIAAIAVRQRPGAGGGESLGPNLVINGTFPGNDTTGYANVRNTTVTDDRLNATGSTNPVADLDLDSPGVETGKTYRLTYDLVAYTVGAGARFLVGTGQSVSQTSVETHTEDIASAGDSAVLRFSCLTGTVVSVDNITLQEVL